MDDRSVFAEFLDLAGHAVVESHAARQQQVGSIGDLDRVAFRVLFEFTAHSPVGVGRAMHPEPTERQFVRLGECAQPHDGRGHRDAGGVYQFAQRLAGICTDDAAADVEHRSLALFDQPNDLIQLKVARFFALGIKSLDVDLVREENLCACLLDVLRHINDHRAGPAAGGDLECLLHHSRDLIDVGDEKTVFHHR